MNDPSTTTRRSTATAPKSWPEQWDDTSMSRRRINLEKPHWRTRKGVPRANGETASRPVTRSSGDADEIRGFSLSSMRYFLTRPNELYLTVADRMGNWRHSETRVGDDSAQSVGVATGTVLFTGYGLTELR